MLGGEKKWVLFDTPNIRNDTIWARDSSQVPPIEQEKLKKTTGLRLVG